MDVLKDNVSQDILQQEKVYSKEQDCALNNVINEHTEKIAQHTTEEVQKTKEYLPEELWHQRLGHKTAKQMATITAMAPQVKNDACNNAKVISSLSAIKKDLDQQETLLCGHAQALTVKAVLLDAQKKIMEPKLNQMDTQFQELKQEADRGNLVVSSI